MCRVCGAARGDMETVVMGDVDGRPGYYDDDGNELNPDLVAKPSLCVSCAKDGDLGEEMLCVLNRLGQQDEPDFECGAYEPSLE